MVLDVLYINPLMIFSIEICKHFLKIIFLLLSRFLQVKFEDLIENPMEILTQISTKLKLSSGKKLNEVFQSHRQLSPTQKLKYFSTHRGQNYSHDNWKKELSPEKQR